MISETQQPGMSKLKRKSLDNSPTSDDGHGDAPNKRPRVGGIADDSAEPDAATAKNGSEPDDRRLAREEDSPVKDELGEDAQLSPDLPPKPAEDDVTSPAPRQERRQSESRRRESSSYARSPHQDRIPGETRRRSRSPPRSQDQDNWSQKGKRHDTSPPRRERRESDTARRDSGSNQTQRDNERNRRGGVNKEEEKKRGKRLFGGLLSTLSQTTNVTQLKRRREIEKRQQEKAAKQKTEDNLRRNERLAKLDKVRKIEQVSFDEHVVRTNRPIHTRIPLGTTSTDRRDRCEPVIRTCLLWHEAFRLKASQSW